MRNRSLREALGIVTALAASCGGRIAGDGASSSSSAGGAGTATPPTPSANDDECPHVVELRGFDLPVSSEAACALAAAAPGCFGFYCQPAAKDCARACGDPSVNQCALPTDYLALFRRLQSADAGPVCPSSGPLTLHCAVTELRGTKRSGCPVEGRRPLGLLDDGAELYAASLGAYFAECEWLEAASVVAFHDLARDLERLDAPRALVDACIAASRDEERHAASTGALRLRFGGQARRIRIDVEPGEERALFDLARENAIEGVVRETFGAAVARWRAEHAEDDVVRRAMARIADDECRHAELARAIADFFDERLDDAARRSLAALRRAAIDELVGTFRDDPTEALARVAGVPRAHEARALLDGLVRVVWADCGAARS